MFYALVTLFDWSIFLLYQATWQHLLILPVCQIQHTLLKISLFDSDLRKVSLRNLCLFWFCTKERSYISNSIFCTESGDQLFCVQLANGISITSKTNAVSGWFVKQLFLSHSSLIYPIPFSIFCSLPTYLSIYPSIFCHQTSVPRIDKRTELLLLIVFR